MVWCSFFILSKILMEHHCQNLFGKLHSVSEITALYVFRHKEHHLSKCSEIIGIGKKYWILVYVFNNKTVNIVFKEICVCYKPSKSQLPSDCPYIYVPKTYFFYLISKRSSVLPVLQTIIKYLNILFLASINTCCASLNPTAIGE